MPRDLPLGNGDMLVTFDARYQLRDIFFPYVGMENHTMGEPCRFGVWVDGQFSWVADAVWQKEIGYQNESLLGAVTLTCLPLGLRLVCRDTVDFDRNLYLKEVTVCNLWDTEREVRIYQHFDAHLFGNDYGDSAYYDPRLHALVHYKGRRYVLLSGISADGLPGLHSFTIARKDQGEAAWQDAEDGKLKEILVSQGSVDSVGQLNLQVPASGTQQATFYLALGKSYEEVRELADLVRERGAESFLTRSYDYWTLWASKDDAQLKILPPELAKLYRQSSLIIRTQIDNRGAIIAGNDSDVLRFNRDTYSYMWPRDGALVAHALDLAGFGEVARRFFTVCGEVITSEGYLLHKYNPDHSLGSSWHAWATPEKGLELPIQEDETGLPLWALWRHYEADRDLEFVRPLYRKLVRKGGEFMTKYREPHTGLPGASFDLWEERRGIHLFTVAAVWAGLDAAHRFADAFGQHTLAATFGLAADQIKDAALIHMYDASVGRFVRTIQVDEQGTVSKDLTLDISMAGVFLFGMLPATDPRVRATMEQLEKRLWIKTEIGGMARYENDNYFQQSADISNVPGNPWFVGTLWLAEYYCDVAETRAGLERALELLWWVQQHALASQVLAEQVHPYSGEPLSVAPLTWSHAGFIAAVQKYVRKYQELKE